MRERNVRFVPLQASWLAFWSSGVPFSFPLPLPAAVHRLDIKSSSGTSVLVSFLLLFCCCSAYERTPCCLSFFEKRLVLEFFGVGSKVTTLLFESLSLSLYTSSARINTCESNNMRATAILLTALVAILPAMGEKSKQIFSHDDPIYGGT